MVNKIRVIEGKKYKLDGLAKKKTDARVAANRTRKTEGKSVRVVKLNPNNSNPYARGYAIYARKGRR